ncbi:MAG: archaellin/type IV pilin N-terminal domain-containing protein [Candidatus Aenigmatarchaeota archaeon]
MKGISPLIATILLIAITVAVGGIVSTWIFGFTRTSIKTAGEQANIEIICGNGGISLSNVCYSNNYLSGYITNTGTISLGNITITILYTNASIQRYYLSFVGGAVVAQTSCCGNLSMLVNEKYMFNVSANGNYDRIYVYTNCTAKVTDEVKASDILSC